MNNAEIRANPVLDKAYRDYVECMDPVNKLCRINFKSALADIADQFEERTIIEGYLAMADINLSYCTACEEYTSQPKVGATGVQKEE